MHLRWEISNSGLRTRVRFPNVCSTGGRRERENNEFGIAVRYVLYATTLACSANEANEAPTHRNPISIYAVDLWKCCSRKVGMKNEPVAFVSVHVVGRNRKTFFKKSKRRGEIRRGSASNAYRRADVTIVITRVS